MSNTIEDFVLPTWWGDVGADWKINSLSWETDLFYISSTELGTPTAESWSRRVSSSAKGAIHGSFSAARFTTGSSFSLQDFKGGGTETSLRLAIDSARKYIAAIESLLKEKAK
jgi:hypothetical protein